MCDCSICNMTEEEQQEEAERYIEWEYQQYSIKTKDPLSFDDWLNTLK